MFATTFSLLALTCCERAPQFRGKVEDPIRPAPDFRAPNWDGSEFVLRDHRSKVVLLAFGFTSCPDVCPFTLRNLSGLSEKLGDEAESVSVVFVTVDPERDTPEKLKAYVPAFHKQFYGLRLQGDAMASLLADYDIKVTKHMPDKPGGYYAVDHTGTVFVIDPAGRLRLTHPHDTSAEALVADVRLLLNEEVKP